MANSLPSHPGSLPVSKWGQKINKHCTSDYWAEDKSAWFDRSLLLTSLPPSIQPFSPSLYSPPASPSPLFNILPVLFSLLYSPSRRLSLLFLHLFLLHPSLTLIPHSLPCSLPFWPAPAVPPYLSHSCLFPPLFLQLWSIKAWWFKILGKYWSRHRGGRARSPGPIQERLQNSSQRPWHRATVSHSFSSSSFPTSFFPV